MTSKKIALTTIGDMRFYQLDSSPLLNGFDAPVGSKALVKENNIGKSFLKIGSDTKDWKEDSTSSGGMLGGGNSKTFISSGILIPDEDIDGKRLISADANLIGATIIAGVSGDQGSSVFTITIKKTETIVTQTIELIANGSSNNATIIFNNSISLQAGDIISISVSSLASGYVENVCIELFLK